MTMLPQPPPNAPAPPPSEAALLSQKKWEWLRVVGVVSITIFALAVLTAPFTFRSRKKGDHTEAVSNARQIGLALFEFENEYGSYPDFTTIAKVRQKSGTALSLDTKFSNDFFRQLLAANFTQSEKMFYAKIPGALKADENIDGAEALKKRECGFTYFMGATTRSNPWRPLVVTPMIPGTDRFDPKPFKGKAIILRVDQSVTSLEIDKDGHAIIAGRNLMDPSNLIWDGHPPMIAWPEL